MRQPLLLALHAVFLLASAVSAQDRPSVRTIIFEPCRIQGIEEELRCGGLDVPENRENPAGRTIRLKIVVVPALDLAPGATPLYHLDGGPGIAATGAADFYAVAGEAFRRTRDVVLVDQRGTGGSHPLVCPALQALSPLVEMYPPEEVRACRFALERQADLRQYTTPIAARDLDEVREALGHDQLDLWALSYGTKLAQVYMRGFPNRVRSAVLVGTVALDSARAPLPHAANGQRALDLLFLKCESDVACSGAFPKLRSEWDSVLARLDGGAIQVRHPSPAAGDDSVISIRRGPFTEIIRNMVSRTANARQLPYLIHRAASDDWIPFLERGLASGGGPMLAKGLYLSIECTEGTGRIEDHEVARRTAGTFAGEYRVRQQIAACGEWPLAEFPDDLNQPVVSTVPVLLLAGEMDGVTPPSWADAVAGHLPNSWQIVFKDLGHVPMGLSNMECYDRITLEFYERGSADGIDQSCIAQMEPPPFLLP